MNWKTDGDYQTGKASTSSAPQVMIVWEKVLQHLYWTERMVFLGFFFVITLFAVMGNLLTLYAVFARNQRMLFKVCLLSLAISDLVFVAASGTNYLSKLSRENCLLWTLGSFGCSIIPFAQTVAILVSSMSLVVIALDRYLAVLNKSKARILQSRIFCFSGLFLVWSLSCGISSPMLFGYKLIEVYVVPEEHVEDFYLAYMCMTDMDATANFYIIVFVFIFAPIFVAFVWLNAIIAKEIWKRRHAPGAQSQSKSKETEEDSSTVEMKGTVDTNTSSNVRNHSSKISSSELKNSAVSSKQPVFTIQPAPAAISETRRSTDMQRRQRQMRMFKVILVLMSTFILCRLPNWIFLLYKLNNHVSGRLNWILLYSFALTGILNCMLNPLLYTFLSETIRITSRIGSVCFRFCRFRGQARKASSHYANNQTMFANKVPRKSDGGIYLGS